MKKLIYLLLVILILFCANACNKDQASTPDFDVQANNIAVNVGDVVSFSISGNADIISFYSGETGKKYSYKNRFSSVNDTVLFSFNSILNSAGDGNLQLLISQDFSGIYSADAISTASWIDLTSLATFASNTTEVNSGKIYLSDFQVAGVPTYLAFKYSAATNLDQKQYTLKSILLNHKLNNGDSTKILDATFTSLSPGWRSVNVISDSNWTPKFSANNTAQFSFTGSKRSTATTIESWLVSGSVDLSKTTPDAGTVIKTTQDNPISEYQFNYSKKGTYEATFVGINATQKNVSNPIVKTFTITVN